MKSISKPLESRGLSVAWSRSKDEAKRGRTELLTAQWSNKILIGPDHETMLHKRIWNLTSGTVFF